MNTNGFKLICDVYTNAVKNDHLDSDTATVMFNIANFENKNRNENTFERIGEFLINNSEHLEKAFEKDRNYGTLSIVPSVPKFIWNEFMKYNG